MKKVLFMLVMLLSVFTLVSCNSAKNVQNNVSNDADNFKVYRKITVMNLMSDTILIEVEGYFSIQRNEFGDLAIVIKSGVDEYKMHYVADSELITYVVEQLENTNTDPYHWRITIYGMLPELTSPED